MVKSAGFDFRRGSHAISLGPGGIPLEPGPAPESELALEEVVPRSRSLIFADVIASRSSPTAFTAALLVAVTAT